MTVAGGDWFDGNGAGGSADVAAMLEGMATQGVVELVEAGALVSLGTTSDGGALGVTVTVDGRWRREYFRSQDDLVAWIGQALPAVRDARGNDGPSGGSRPRSRSRQTR